jgi:SAM-dependent methyltransferase
VPRERYCYVPRMDAANAAFWSEICGLTLARETGTEGRSAQSIRAYDRAFFDFYPYLAGFVRFDELRGKEVLEVGLGYGSVSQRLAESGANFTGLDVSQGPVDWVNHRLNTFGLPGKAAQGSILDAPFPSQSFDAVIAIGCYHHTGDMKRAITETARLLRPGGRFVMMVYNALSYYRWMTRPKQTAAYLLSRSYEPLSLDQDSRRAFDQNKNAEAAPATVAVSKPGLRSLLGEQFSDIQIMRRNFGGHRLTSKIPRRILISAGPLCGPDLYATCISPAPRCA